MSARDVEFDFGEVVRQLRDKKGWTQAELAEQMTRAGYETHQVTVGKIESAGRPTRVGEVAALAAIFTVPVADLFAEQPPCGTCKNSPPAGFICQTCGRAA